MAFKLTDRVAPDFGQTLVGVVDQGSCLPQVLAHFADDPPPGLRAKKDADLIMIMPHWWFLKQQGRSITHRQGRLGKLSRRCIGVNDPPQGLRDGLYVLGCWLSCGVLFHLTWCERFALLALANPVLARRQVPVLDWCAVLQGAGLLTSTGTKRQGS